MSQEFSSPADLLSYIQTERYVPVPKSDPNIEFQKIYKEKQQNLKQQGIPVQEIPDGSSAHELIIQNLWQDIKTALPNDSLDWCNQTLAVGLLDNMHVNAACIRGPGGFYAIILHSGLLTLLNKVSKLLLAIANPEAVMYSSRETNIPLKSQTVFDWYLEVTEHYRQTKTPLGPQIHLYPDFDPQHLSRLYHWESFILCHELGHLLCSHLEGTGCWEPNREFGMMETLSTNQRHSMEHEADIFGYLLMRRASPMNDLNRGSERKATIDGICLMNTVSLFDLMYLLGGLGSDAHPDALTRGIVLTEAVYGKEIGCALAESYQTPSKLAGNIDQLGSPMIDLNEFINAHRQ